MTELNPTWLICFWCGKEYDLALLDEKDLKGKKNVQTAIMNYEPCKECQEYWDRSVNILEVDTKPLQEGQPPIYLEYYPTTMHINIAAELFEKEEGMEEGLIILVNPDGFKKWEERAIELAKKSDDIE